MFIDTTFHRYVSIVLDYRFSLVLVENRIFLVLPNTFSSGRKLSQNDLFA